MKDFLYPIYRLKTNSHTAVYLTLEGERDTEEREGCKLSPYEIVFFTQPCISLGNRSSFSPSPSLCPSWTCQLSDIAVILSHSFIGLSNGNPPVFSLHSPFFNNPCLFSLLCPISQSLSSPSDTHRALRCPINCVI